MAKVLLIKANDRPAEQAISVQMYEAFAKAYKESHPEDVVTELDLFSAELPYYGNAAITAMYKQGQGWELTAEEQKLAATVNQYLDQFLEADKIAIAFPLWNFTVPAPLITYISYLTQAGKTFKYTAQGPVGLVTGKKAVLLHARGGVYSSEPMASVEAAMRFVKGSLGLWGVQTEDVIIEGHNQFQDRTAEIVSAGLAETAKLAERF